MYLLPGAAHSRYPRTMRLCPRSSTVALRRAPESGPFPGDIGPAASCAPHVTPPLFFPAVTLSWLVSLPHSPSCAGAPPPVLPEPVCAAALGGRGGPGPGSGRHVRGHAGHTGGQEPLAPSQTRGRRRHCHHCLRGRFPGQGAGVPCVGPLPRAA